MPAPEYLIISEHLWQVTMGALGPYAGAELEAGLFWFGVRNEACAVVSTVGVPAQTNFRTSFQISADSMARMVRSVQRPLLVVAQVHTHPGPETEHSSWDAELVVSRRILSLVLPHFGNVQCVHQAGVHEYRGGMWRRLSSSEAARRIVVASPISDTRT